MSTKVKRIQVSFCARNLDNVDTTGKSDAFLVIKHGSKKLAQTKHISNNLDPDWPSFELNLNNFSEDEKLSLLVYDYDKILKNEVIGENQASVGEIINVGRIQTPASWELINEKKAKKDQYKNSGVLHLNEVKILEEVQIIPLDDIESETLELNAAVENNINSEILNKPLINSETNVSDIGAAAVSAPPEIEGIEELDSPVISPPEVSQDILEKNIEEGDLDLEALPPKYFVQYIDENLRHIIKEDNLIKMDISCKNLDDLDAIGKSDPFLEIWCDHKRVKKTKKIENTLSPSWEDIEITIPSLVPTEYTNLEITIDCYDKDTVTNELIGRCSFDVNTLLSLIDKPNDLTLEIINDHLRKKKGAKYSNSGTITLHNVSIIKLKGKDDEKSIPKNSLEVEQEPNVPLEKNSAPETEAEKIHVHESIENLGETVEETSDRLSTNKTSPPLPTEHETANNAWILYAVAFALLSIPAYYLAKNYMS